MKKKLIKISLFLSLIGILLLFIVSIFTEPSQTKINEISKKDLDNYVKITGTVINIKEIKAENYFFKIIKLKDSSGSINIIQNSKEKLEINQKIEVIGRVSEYNQEIQIETKEIKFLK
jgi:RecJ-like exonuclease